MVDEGTIIVARKKRGDNVVNKSRDVSGFTTYGEYAKPMENSEYRPRSYCKMTRSSKFTFE
jgi:hypothetical protein